MRVLLCIAFSCYANAAVPMIEANELIPPKDYKASLKVPVATSNANAQLQTLSLVGSPNTEQKDGPTVKDVTAKNRVAILGKSSSSSITAQAVVDGMDLTTCAEQVKFTQRQYDSFHDALTSIGSKVKTASIKLKSIDVITHNVQTEEANFVNEIKRIQELYNTLAVRSNALGRWMSEEKMLRDNLQELYRELVARNREEESRLVVLTKTMRDALLRLNSLEKEISGTMSLIASAQKAMYGWANEVTVSVNTHTTKLGSLTQNMQYRVTQIDKALPEIKEVAKRAVYIARALGETNAAAIAGASLMQVQSVLDSGRTSGTILSIPSSSS